MGYLDEGELDGEIMAARCRVRRWLKMKSFWM